MSEIKLNQPYYTRNGGLAIARDRKPARCDSVYPLIGSCLFLDGACSHESWMENGVHSLNELNDCDIMPDRPATKEVWDKAWETGVIEPWKEPRVYRIGDIVATLLDRIGVVTSVDENGVFVCLTNELIRFKSKLIRPATPEEIKKVRGE